MDYIRNMIGRLFGVLLLAFVLYLVFLFVRIYVLISRRRKSVQKPRAIQGVMVKDEICNTYIPKDDALLESRSGRDHFFCSQECRRKFLRQADSPPGSAQ